MMTYLVAWLSTCGLCWALFSRGEAILSPDVKVRVRNVLQGESDLTGRVETWPQQFGHLFDAVFTEKHFSWKCFGRTALASLFAVGITLLLVITIRTHDSGFSLDFLKLHVMPIYLYVILLLLNVVADYLSLLESRAVIQWMSAASSKVAWWGFLFLDIVCTGIIFVGLAWVLTTIYDVMIPPFERVSAFLDPGATKSVDQRIQHVSVSTILVTFLFSTFFASVWVWLYALSCFLVRTAKVTDRSWNVLTYCIDIENKPVLSLGTISIVLITLGYLVAAPFVLLH